MAITPQDLSAVTFTDAQLMVTSHAIVRALKRAAGEADPGPLATAPAWMIEASGERVQAVESGASLDPEQEHERWAASKRRKGYMYGPVRNDDPDAGPLTHPLLVPFGQLDLLQQLKDSLPNEVVAELAGRAAP